MADIIAAVSTAIAPSGIGVIRLSGDGCIALADKLLRPVYGKNLSASPDRKMVLSDLFDRQGRVIDRILAVKTAGPGSYTGEDTAELQCHGSPAVLGETLQHLFALGARQALPGEFTKRAFLNGRMDLTAAEAVIDLIDAETADAAANAAGQVGGALLARIQPVYDTLISVMSHFHAVLDYPDEEIDAFEMEGYRALLEEQKGAIGALLATARRGSLVKNGVRAVILGRPNAGKSSLLNALAGYDRAIVTDIPGTTRDTVEEKLKLGSLLLRLSDTAGIRDTDDPVEKIGVERARAAAEGADLALVVLDSAAPLTEEDQSALAAAKAAANRLVILNKSDLPPVLTPENVGIPDAIPLSAVTGKGIDALTEAAEKLFASGLPCDGTLLTNARQIGALTRAQSALEDALSALTFGLTPDALLMYVEDALSELGLLLGREMREDITADIFSRFCVGK